MSTAAPSLPPLREVIARHGIRARHGLGQHFLLDLNVTARIARAAGELAGGTVVEVGPGPGGLTRALLDAGAGLVVAIERDARCVAALAELAPVYGARLVVIEGDALAADTAALAQEHGGVTPLTIVANLPYNIATALIIRWLGQIGAYRAIVVMVQREVADRMTAAPRTADYGRLSVITQWLCRAERVFDLPPQAFVPPPKVTSSVVRLTPLAAPRAPAEMATLERVTGAAFGQRRKMLRGALKSLDRDPLGLLAETGIVPTRRAEELSVEEFCALARAVDARRSAD